MSSPLVSIIISSHNQRRLLSEAIASAVAQTYTPLEIIVVDDGSTDDPAAIVSQFTDVRLIRQPHRGTGAAWNAGFRASSGDALVFLQTDERLLPSAVATGAAALEAHADAAIAFGTFQWIDANGHPIELPPVITLAGDPYE